VEDNGDEDATVKATNFCHESGRARDDWGASVDTQSDRVEPCMVERDLCILWHDL
jgi:hypothetical protein